MAWFPKSIGGLIGAIVLIAVLPTLIVGILSVIPTWVWAVVCVVVVVLGFRLLSRGKGRGGGGTVHHHHNHYWH